MADKPTFRAATIQIETGGNTFQKMGIVEPYKHTSLAEGRSVVTGPSPQTRSAAF